MDSIVHTESLPVFFFYILLCKRRKPPLTAQLPLLPPPQIPHSRRRRTIAAGPEMDEAKASPEKKDPSRTSPVKGEQQQSVSPEKGDRPSDSPGKSEEVRAGSSPGKRDKKIRRPKIIEKDLRDASPGKSEGLQADSSPEKMDERSRHPKIEKDPLTDSPGKSEEVPTESLLRKMDERGCRREIEEKGIHTASPEKSEGVPAESSSVGKDPTPASPCESDGVQENASSPANRVSSSAHPGKSAEIAAASSPRKSEGPSAESSAEKIVRLVDKGKALVVESDEVVESAPRMARSDLPPLLPKVVSSFLDADSQDSSPGRRHCSTYKGKAVVIDSGEGIEPAARVGGSDLPRLLRNVDTSFLDCDDEGDKASEPPFLLLYRIF